MDQDPEPGVTRHALIENETDQPTEEELAASADPDAPEDTVEDDELDEDKQLTQPSFHFDRA
jgi:hypothetical protein